MNKALIENFGSCDEFKKQLATASIAVQGSGWGWLGFNPQTKKLSVVSCANQDPLFPTTGKIIWLLSTGLLLFENGITLVCYCPSTFETFIVLIDSRINDFK